MSLVNETKVIKRKTNERKSIHPIVSFSGWVLGEPWYMFVNIQIQGKHGNLDPSWYAMLLSVVYWSTPIFVLRKRKVLQLRQLQPRNSLRDQLGIEIPWVAFSWTQPNGDQGWWVIPLEQSEDSSATSHVYIQSCLRKLQVIITSWLGQTQFPRRLF